MKKAQAAERPVVEQLRPGRGSNLALWVILAAYAVFAVAAALVVPTDYGPAQVRLTPPDETAHIAIVQYIVENHRLPVFTSGAGLYEAHQPPLFYLSCVPGYLIGRALGGGEFGRFGIILLRLWSALWGAVTVWAVWKVGGGSPHPPARRTLRVLFTLSFTPFRRRGRTADGPTPGLRPQGKAASPPRPPSPSLRSGGGGRTADGPTPPAVRAPLPYREGKGKRPFSERATADDGRPWRGVQVLAAGLAALLPGRVFITSAISNDAMSEAFCALALLLCVIGVQEGRFPARRALLLGLVTGLALLTKTNSLALALVILVAFALAQRRLEALVGGPQGKASAGGGAEVGGSAAGQVEIVQGLGIAVGCVVVLWGWWVARNMALYGEPLAMKTFVEVFGKDRPGPEYFARHGLSGAQYFQLVSWQTALSFWGIFGQANVFMPKLYYALGHALAAVAAVGLVWAGVRARAGEGAGSQDSDPAWWVIAAQLVLTVALFYRFNADFFQAQARYLFPATGAWACVLAAGWAGWRSKWLPPAVLVALAGMAAWAIVAFVTGDAGTAGSVMGG